MSDYYVKRGGELAGPFPTYTRAMEENARELWYGAPVGELRVLLDVGSVNAEDVEELRELLHHEPLMSALFTLGRRYEQERARERR
ncbi:hypothetical protein PBI_OKIROE_74 [Mycobacterium phage OkiRoe]|uniref:Uncharacterized protein n=1 Tax=Mycobacterium phage Gengar TaxID=1891963 RepID=A0A1C9EGW3_9CAUD|nr:hypothetical protein PBI_OKIROE_74 [Mycobacterium phage OkiRoe]YP_009282318.1 hypothetical protein SEA_GENGAR_73 [Mycobacterium phage Gengar]AHZ95635.1 hypothetical protein PBI_OKIROE_74 [Mycobacterium phage OkiRoe]AON96728.1 hypothetical protein SEA_GENGAR_73 [Mycobacterium phage Gengar]